MTVGDQAQNNSCADSFPTSPFFQFEKRNSSYARKDVFFLERVLVKVRFLDSTATNSKFWALLFTTRYQRNYVENFGQTDRETDDIAISKESMF
jgi:hypothetical protein